MGLAENQWTWTLPIMQSLLSHKLMEESKPLVCREKLTVPWQVKYQEFPGKSSFLLYSLYMWNMVALGLKSICITYGKVPFVYLQWDIIQWCNFLNLLQHKLHAERTNKYFAARRQPCTRKNSNKHTNYLVPKCTQ